MLMGQFTIRCIVLVMANLNTKNEVPVPHTMGSQKLKRWLLNPARTQFEGILSSVG